MALFRLCFVITALLGSSFAFAVDEAGRVIFARGVVSAVDESDSRRGLRTGDLVHEGDRIVTGRSAVVQIHLSDGALLGLRGNSEYLIARQQYEPESDLAEQAGELFSGWMRMITGAIGKSRPDNVRVSTSVATIGIRGTVFQLLHVPESGLEGFNDVDPGSYVMLEDGGIDFFNDGGMRRVGAGEVAFAGALSQQPEPRPDRRHLFARHLESLSVSRDDVRRLRLQYFLREQNSDANGSLQTVLDKEILSTTFVNLGALSSYSPGGRNVRLTAGAANLLYAAGDATRVLTGVRGDPGDASLDFLQFSGGAPVATGQALIGGVYSQVHWGIWREGTFDAVNSSTGPYAVTGDWHYMFASNLQPDPSVLTATLTGSFTYDYVGGTPLTNSTGAADFTNVATIGRILGGQLNVDFGSALMQADLGLSLPDVLTPVAVSGGGSLTQFYATGLTLADGLGVVSGNIQGAFVGPAAEGAISAVEINDAGNNANYQGMAAFERTGPGVALP